MSISEILKITLGVFLGVGIVISLRYFLEVSEEEAQDMGIVTAKMQRDPEVKERLDRETPLHIKKSLQEDIQIVKESEMAGKEIGEDGVVRRKSL